MPFMRQWRPSLHSGNDTERRVLAYLGFAARARKIVAGVPLLCQAMQRGGAYAPLVVLEARDTSDHTHKRVCDRTAFYGVPAFRLSRSTAELAHAIGKRDGAVAAVGVTDTELASAILALLAVGDGAEG